jgi:uridine kinase
MSNTLKQYVRADIPTVVEVKNGVKIHIDENGNIEVEGHNNITFKCQGNMDFDASNINMHAKSMIMNIDGPVYAGSSDKIIFQAPLLHLNPLISLSGYFGNIKRKTLQYFKFIEGNNASSS